MKTFSSEALAALADGTAIVSGAVRFGLPDPARFWGGHGFQVIDEQAFLGLGDRGLISVSSGTLGGQAQGAELILSGVDPDVAAALDVRQLRGVPVVIWRLIFDGSGRTLLQASVYLRGRVDSAPTEDRPGGPAVLRLGIEGPARGLGRRSERMRSDADQRLISPTDGALKRVAYAAQKPIYWGGRPPERASSAFASGSSAGGVGGLGEATNVA
ncbi:hypothetical protein [Brevundimonas sp.]|uniref:hypothetical protein n=1 Tax=Brevundimonas sp. TaxID=1871086 RepID=UPI001A2D8629|nr:hypothetical protein [Brevundimonas sp.]MBJ7485969.1 hypothetical protein [Brevundimonas sp.]